MIKGRSRVGARTKVPRLRAVTVVNCPSCAEQHQLFGDEFYFTEEGFAETNIVIHYRCPKTNAPDIKFEI